MRYVAPRHLDVADQLLPGWTTGQLVATLAGAGAAFLIAQAPLGWEVKAWPVLWLPVLGAVAKRRLPVRGGCWDGLALAGAWWGYVWRPRRRVWQAGAGGGS